ncbi:MAG: PAS domain S-box protein [Chloroflexota bacterium]
MKKPYKPSDAWEDQRHKIIGLGEHSLKKSYYPELRQRLAELERFKALLDQSNDAIFLAQMANGRFVDANETARCLLGYSLEELLALSINDITPPDLTIEVDKISTNQLPDVHNPNIITTAFHAQNGRVIPIEITLHKVLFQEEKYVVIVARNIAQRRQAEEALRESETRFRWMAENISDGLMILEKNKVLYMNQRACTLLGYSYEQINRMSVKDFAAPNEKFVISQIVQMSMKTNSVPAEMEFWIEQQGGEQRFINFRLSQHQINPDTSRFYIIMTDLTARKEREAELEQRVLERTHELAEANLQLQKLDQIKSAFVSNVSHELRTPITNIQLYLNLLGQTQDTQKESRFLQILTSEARRLGNLIEDLLTLSRLENKTNDVMQESYTLDPVIAQVVLTHSANAAARHISIFHKPNSKLPAIPMVKDRISQVFTNLIANAVTYTPAYGQITIFSEQEEDENGRFVLITFHNDGPPIPESDLPYIFDRFYRGENAKRADNHGTGLGLAICREIIHSHQGDIAVHSKTGQGTTFTIRLPL